MKAKYRAVCTNGCYRVEPLESKKDAEFRAAQHASLYRHDVTVIKETLPKKSEWKQGFRTVPAVDIFKPDTIRQTLEWFNKQAGGN